MGKRARVFSLAMLLCISALAGCRGPEPGPTEPSIGPTAPEASTEAPADATSGTAPSEAPGTVPSLPESSASAIEPSRLADFDQRLSVLGATSSEEFCANYQEALALYEAGLRPEAAMPTYDPRDFYRAKLDPVVYGVSQFFVLPVGEQSLTVEEYLELVEASGATWACQRTPSPCTAPVLTPALLPSIPLTLSGTWACSIPGAPAIWWD